MTQEITDAINKHQLFFIYNLISLILHEDGENSLTLELILFVKKKCVVKLEKTTVNEECYYGAIIYFFTCANRLWLLY